VDVAFSGALRSLATSATPKGSLADSIRMNENRSTTESFFDELAGEPAGDILGEPPEPTLQVLIADEQSTLAVDESQLRAAVQAVFRDSPYHTGTVSIAIVDDPTIQEINRLYLEHDYPTDVLSFVLEDRAPYLEGELIVSTDTAHSNAEAYGWSSRFELLLYVVHGALHLVGYRDKQPEEIVEMRSAELRLLQELDVAVSNSSTRWFNQTATESSTREAPPS